MPSYLTSYKSEMTIFDEPVLPKDDLNHFVFLDVHTHSDCPKVSTFIDEIYSAHFAGPFTAVQRKHLKIVLLHLSVAWSEGPRLYTVVAFNENDYEAGSRYNALHISSRINNIIKQIKRLGLLTTNEKHQLCQHLRKKIEVTRFRNAYKAKPTTQSLKRRQKVA